MPHKIYEHLLNSDINLYQWIDDHEKIWAYNTFCNPTLDQSYMGSSMDDIYVTRVSSHSQTGGHSTHEWVHWVNEGN